MVITSLYPLYKYYVALMILVYRTFFTSHIYLNMRMIFFLFIQLSRWPSSLVLQCPGLQPALKSVRVSKAMSALQSFVELLTGMDVLLPLVKIVRPNFYLSL